MHNQDLTRVTTESACMSMSRPGERSRFAATIASTDGRDADPGATRARGIEPRAGPRAFVRGQARHRRRRVEKQKARRRLKEPSSFEHVANRWVDTAPMADSTQNMRRSIFNREVQLNIARSRTFFATFNCCRMAQMCLGLSGALGPKRQPAVHGRLGCLNGSDWRMANLH